MMATAGLKPLGLFLRKRHLPIIPYFLKTYFQSNVKLFHHAVLGGCMLNHLMDFFLNAYIKLHLSCPYENQTIKSKTQYLTLHLI